MTNKVLLVVLEIFENDNLDARISNARMAEYRMTYGGKPEMATFWRGVSERLEARK